jgi:hypothetical protein
VIRPVTRQRIPIMRPDPEPIDVHARSVTPGSEQSAG